MTAGAHCRCSCCSPWPRSSPSVAQSGLPAARAAAIRMTRRRPASRRISRLAVGDQHRRRPRCDRVRRGCPVEQLACAPGVHHLRPARAGHRGRAAATAAGSAARRDRGGGGSRPHVPGALRGLSERAGGAERGARRGAAGVRAGRGPRAGDGDRDRRLAATGACRREPDELHRAGRRHPRHRDRALGGRAPRRSPSPAARRRAAHRPSGSCRPPPSTVRARPSSSTTSRCRRRTGSRRSDRRAARPLPRPPDLPGAGGAPDRRLRAPVRQRSARRADAAGVHRQHPPALGRAARRSSTDGRPHGAAQPLRGGAHHRHPAGRSASVAGAADRAVEPLRAGALDPDRDALRSQRRAQRRPCRPARADPRLRARGAAGTVRARADPGGRRRARPPSPACAASRARGSRSRSMARSTQRP